MGDKQGHPFRGNQWTGQVVLKGTVGRIAFQKALTHVQETYPSMFHEDLSSIEFTPQLDGNRKAHGHFFPPGVVTDPSGKVMRDAEGNLLRGKKVAIQIKANRRAVESFVNTLTHELTHLKQHLEKRPFSEEEAHRIGNTAELMYKHKKVK